MALSVESSYLMTDTPTHLNSEERYLDLKHKARAGIFYHQRLAARYQTWLRISSFVSLFFALAAGGAVAGRELLLLSGITWLSDAFSVVSIVILAANSAIILGFDVVYMSTRHQDLARDWNQNLGDIESTWDRICENEKSATFSECSRRQHEIDDREPSTKLRLGRWAERKSATAIGLQKPTFS